MQKFRRVCSSRKKNLDGPDDPYEPTVPDPYEPTDPDPDDWFEP